MFRIILSQLFALLIIGSLCAQDKSVNIWFDNDLLYIPKNKDRDYTIGMGLKLANYQIKYNPASIGLRWVDKASFVQKLHQKGNHISHSDEFIFKLFTPDDLNESSPIYQDRPYASVFSFASTRMTKLPKHNILIQSGLEVGIMGLIVAKDVQSGAHFIVREVRKMEEPYAPQGWDNQIGKGGEPIIRYRFDMEKNLEFLTWKSGRRPMNHFDLQVNSGVSLGYQTYLESGIQGRFGWIGEKKGLYLHGRFGVKLVGYNALLQGQFRPSVHELTYRQLNPLVSRWQAGLTLRRPTWAMDYTLYSRSAEMKRTNHPRHVWAGLTVSFFR